MPKGDAFNRMEVSSVYVSPKDRYIVSFVVGYTGDQIDSAPQAAAAAIEMMVGEESAQVHVSVYDRNTGDTVDLTREEVDMLLRPHRGLGS